MQELTIFNKITTAQVLSDFASIGDSYTDLYVDMNDTEQRRFVKGKAAEITGLLKKLDRARIDKTKESKAEIDAEFKIICDSLNMSNKPFTDLIDEYKAERKRILDEEKRIQAEKDAYYQMGIDHADAIDLNKLFDLEAEKRERERKENEAKLLAEAEEKRLKDVEQAKIDERNKAQAIIQQAADEKAKREADQEHVKNILTNVKLSLMQCNLTEDQARAVTLAIKNGQIFNTSIKF